MAWDVGVVNCVAWKDKYSFFFCHFRQIDQESQHEVEVIQLWLVDVSSLYHNVYSRTCTYVLVRIVVSDLGLAFSRPRFERFSLCRVLYT